MSACGIRSSKSSVRRNQDTKFHILQSHTEIDSTTAKVNENQQRTLPSEIAPIGLQILEPGLQEIWTLGFQMLEPLLEKTSDHISEISEIFFGLQSWSCCISLLKQIVITR
jgi:hypothetical protein